MTRALGLIGVPSSAGAITPGQEKGPAAVRAAGFVDLLRAAGCEVHDHGDLPIVRFQPDPANRRRQNLAAVVSVARSLAEVVDRILGSGQVPIVVGGDCSVTVGAVSGFVRAGLDLSLLYVDGGVDLYVPGTQKMSHFDSMGVAHMLDEPGAALELSHLGPRWPLLDPRRVVFFGQGASSTRAGDDLEDPEARVFARHPFRAWPLSSVHGRPKVAAREARAAIESDGGTFLVHFDVDVLDFLDCPLADVPEEVGLTLDEAMVSLREFFGSPRCGGLVVTEINPDHGDSAGAAVARFTRELATALGRSP